MGDVPAKLTRLYPLLSNLWFFLPSQSPSSVNDFALLFRDKLGGAKWDISYFATTHFFPLLISALIFFFPVIISAIKAISSTWALDLFLSLYSFIFPTPHCTYLLLLSFPLEQEQKQIKNLFDSYLFSIHCSFSQHVSSAKLLCSLHINSSIYCFLFSISTVPPLRWHCPL